MSRNFVHENRYEHLIKKICGAQWKSLPDNERDAAWGIAIVKSVLDGIEPNLQDISNYLGVDRDTLLRPFKNLNMNGVFLHDRIQKDSKALKSEDSLAWCYYGGYASGAIGPVVV